MLRIISAGFIGLLFISNPASALCTSYPYTLTNGTTADGGQVMANFNCAALTSGATLNGATLTGATSLGGATSLPGGGTISSTGDVGIRTSSPNATLDVAGVINGRNYVIPSTDATPQWAKIGTFAATQTGETIRIVAYIHNGYNATNSQDGIYEFTFKTSNGGATDGNGFAGNGNYYATGYNNSLQPGYVKWKANASGVFASAFDLYMYLPSYTLGSHYQVTLSASSSWTNAGAGGQADPGAASSSVLIPSLQFSIPFGNVGIDTTSPSYPLHVNGTAYATGAAGALSDVRHKRDIAPLGNALDKVMQLRPVTFQWKEPKDGGMHGTQTGFIAQDVEKVLPSTVLTESDAEKTKGLKYNELIAVLTKAVQEQQAEIEELKTANMAQSAAIARLSSQNARMQNTAFRGDALRSVTRQKLRSDHAVSGASVQTVLQ